VVAVTVDDPIVGFRCGRCETWGLAREPAPEICDDCRGEDVGVQRSILEGWSS
jgi:hypothetical protein